MKTLGDIEHESLREDVVPAFEELHQWDYKAQSIGEDFILCRSMQIGTKNMLADTCSGVP